MSMRDGFANLIRRARAGVQARLDALTPRQKRRWRRGTIVSLIAAGGLLGFDYVVTGGPDWNPMGAGAPRFELVSSAAAAEHPLLPRSIAAEPAPVLPERVVIEAALDARDPNISADDLLGAPVYGRMIDADVQMDAWLDTLKAESSPQIELLVQPVAAPGQWWR
jgi:hypothetical protein